ncbi:MAG: DUF1345 domain-containing protein [Solirubrobacterales bacterium]|nr:DUF1345 domain-containing protein [Solirubrobacterales bacterium]
MKLSSGDRNELGVVEPFWQAQLAILLTLLLYFALPSKLTIGPRWLLPLLEGVLLIGLAVSTPYRHHTQSPIHRWMSLGLIAIVTLTNFVALGMLIHLLLAPNKAAGRDLIVAAGQIWLTNVAVFALWFWETDRGGPHLRTRSEPLVPDFLFPQMEAAHLPFKGWRPGFLDYLYVAFTNATAFSPTDAMPLSVRVKALMVVESVASFLTVGLVAARAVNILG